MDPVNVWEQIGDTLAGMFMQMLRWTRTAIEAYAPGLLVASLTLVAGWLAAALARRFVAKLLRALGFDVIAERLGLRNFLRRREVALAPSAIVGWAIYLIVLFATLRAAVDHLGLEALAHLLREIVAFLPRVFVVAVLLALGVFLARAIGSLVARAARVAGAPLHGLIGAIARISIDVLTFVVCLDYLQLASREVLLAALGVLIIGALVAAGLVALCARGLVGNLMAHTYVASEYRPGDWIRLGELEGVIESLGRTVVRVRDGDRSFLVPNERFVRETVERRAMAVAAERQP